MRRRARSILAVGALLIGGASFAPIAQAQPGSPTPSDPDEVKVFRAEVTQKQVTLLLAAGQDGHELSERVPEKGTATVEVYLTDQQAKKLEKQGVGLTEHELSTRAETRVEDAAEGVFRPYSGKGACGRNSCAPPRRTRTSPRSSPSARPSRARTSSR